MTDIPWEKYAVAVGSDVAARDGMFLEIRDGADHLLEIFCSDIDGTMTLSAFREDLPLELVEWAIGEARRRLTPVPSS